MKKRLLFLTGSPGIGKTTVLLKVTEALRARGYSVGGMASREVRCCGSRIGFEILDLHGSEQGWLAHVDFQNGPRIGRYHVNLGDLERLGVAALAEAVEDLNVVVIDEIGPMELLSEKFKQAVKTAIESKRLVIGIIHWKVRDKLIEEVKAREDAEVFEVTSANREELHRILIEKAGVFLEDTSLGKTP